MCYFQGYCRKILDIPKKFKILIKSDFIRRIKNTCLICLAFIKNKVNLLFYFFVFQFFL